MDLFGIALYLKFKVRTREFKVRTRAITRRHNKKCGPVRGAHFFVAAEKELRMRRTPLLFRREETHSGPHTRYFCVKGVPGIVVERESREVGVGGGGGLAGGRRGFSAG